MTDHDHDHDDDGEHDNDPMAPFMDIFREKMEELEPIARKMGLYVQSAGLTIAPPEQNPSGAPMPVLLAHFTIGDVAWSDRVQNAEQYSTEAQFRQIAVQSEKEKFEEMQRDLQARLSEGKELFDPIEDDEDGS
jgi:hypothetical protein